jgi:hypothetical protein
MVVLYAIHLAFLFYFMPTDRMTGEVAMSGFGDYATHINQAALFSEGLVEWGETWVYDPFLIAGYPAGTLFDIDNKAWQLWVHMGRYLGWNLVQGFNWYILMAHLLVPAVMAFVARCFDLRYSAVLIAVGFGVGMWWFDSFVHWCWWAGMLAFTFAGYCFLIPLACFYRWSKRPTSWPWAIATALTLGVLHLMHPFAFFACVVPMLVLFARSWKRLTKLQRGKVFGMAGVVLLMNGWWLINALSHWHYLVDSSHYGQSSIKFLLGDIASLMLQPETTGMVGTRAGFRMLAWGLGVLGLWRWYKAGDERGYMLGAGWCFGFFLTYCGGYIFLTAQIQPFRFVMPVSYLAALPASVFLLDALRELREEGKGKLAPRMAGVFAFLATMLLIRDVNYFMSRALPDPVPNFDGINSHMYGVEGYPIPAAYDYAQFAPPVPVIDYVRKHDDGQSRWLVDVSFLGEELAWSTRAQIMGGFVLRNVKHSWANYFRRYPQGITRPEELRKYMETFGIGWVMVGHLDHYLNRVENPELELFATIAHIRIYKPKFEARLVTGGDPNKPPHVEAKVNQIKITGSDPNADLLVRYHWLEKLICKPDCRIERAPSDPVDVVGFMKIPAPHPADFEIVNGY